MIKNSVFIVSGDYRPYAIERLEFQGDQLISQQVIGNTVYSYIPVLLEVPANYLTVLGPRVSTEVRRNNVAVPFILGI